MSAEWCGIRSVIRVSHSLLVTIPADVCEKMNIKKGDQVKVTITPLEEMGIRYS